MTDKEKNASIELILDKGFVKPPTFIGHVKKMHNTIGLAVVFWDLSYSFIFAAVTLLGVAFMLRHAPVDYRYAVAFVFSPVVFLTIMFFSEISERSCKLYELKQTFRFTSQQISVLRCIFYSVVGAVFAVFMAAFAAESIAQFFRVVPLCLGGLFVCAALKLSFMRLSRSKWAIIIFSVAWICINLALPLALRERWELFLSGLPVVLTITFTILGLVVFVVQLNKMLMEENIYAYAQ